MVQLWPSSRQSLLFLGTTAFLWQNVYGAGSFLTKEALYDNKAQDVLGHITAKHGGCSAPVRHRRHLSPFQNPTNLRWYQLKGPIETTLCNYETVESVNDDLYGYLQQLVKTPFFKYFKVSPLRLSWPTAS